MRKSSKGSKASVKAEQPAGEFHSTPSPLHTLYIHCGYSNNNNNLHASPAGDDDVKVKAVNEMMERIKHGVVLRPVKSQESKVRTRRAWIDYRSFEHVSANESQQNT